MEGCCHSALKGGKILFLLRLKECALGHEFAII